MRLFVIVGLIALTISASARNQQQNKPRENGDHATPAPNPSSPVTVVVGQPFSIPQKESAPAQTKNWYDGFWPPIWSNWALVLVAAIAAKAAIHTLRAIDSQVIEMRKTGEQTDKLIKENIAQSTSLECSVRETARFATAMEGVSNSLETTAKISSETLSGFRLQMRAYVTTAVGGAGFQERSRNIKFMASPLLQNNGLTPAHKVRHKSKSAILPVPLPNDFDYPLPDAYAGETIVAPRQQNQINIVVDGFIDDTEVNDVKVGNGQGLYVWGIIEYEDVFGQTWHTRFCQFLTWLPDGNIYGQYIPGHNDGT